MLATKRPDFAESHLLGRPTAELKFRVQGGEHDGRVLRISSAKCSIGSAAGCTLRLRARDIEPLHCLILCGRTGTVIRRNSPRTYLNGGAFEDAPLRPGDVLRIASRELLVVSCPEPTTAKQTVTQPIPDAPKASAAELERQIAERAEQRAKQIVSRVRQEAQAEITRLERSVEALREQSAEPLAQQRKNRSEQQARESVLQRELSAAQERYRELQSRLAMREQTAVQETEALHSRVQDLAQQLAKREQELANFQPSGSQDNSALTAALEQARQELRELQAQRSRDEEQWNVVRNELQEQHKTIAARLGEKEHDLNNLRQIAMQSDELEVILRQLEEDLAATNRQLDQERATWATERSRHEAELATARLDGERRCQAIQEELCRIRDERELALQEKETQQREACQSEGQAQHWQEEAKRWQLQAEDATAQRDNLQQLCQRLEAEASSTARDGSKGDVESDSVRERFEMQCQELAAARARLESEQAQVAWLVSATTSREQSLAHFEAELRERERAWEESRNAEAAALEQRSQLIASQIAHFEAEQTAFARQQATIIQQMSALEDRVLELTSSGESRSTSAPCATNSPFVIPRVEDSGRASGFSAAEEPHGHGSVQRETIPFRTVESPAVGPPPAEAFIDSSFKFEMAEGAETSRNQGDSAVGRLMQAGVWKEGNEAEDSEQSVAEPAVQEEQKYQPPSFLAQAAELARQEELALAAGLELPPVEPVQEAPLTPTAAEKPGAAHDQDDSIEQYMARLLTRMRGSEESRTSEGAPDDQAVSIVDGAAFANSETPAITPAAELQDYVRRPQPPEQAERLSLMRELANTAAQSAIHAHVRKRAKNETKRKSLVAMLSLIGAASLGAVAVTTGSILAVVGTLAFFGAFCFMTFRAIQNAIRQMRLGRPAEIAQPEPVPAVATEAKAEEAIVQP